MTMPLRSADLYLWYVGYEKFWQACGVVSEWW